MVLLGDEKVGKTTLMFSYSRGQYYDGGCIPKFFETYLGTTMLGARSIDLIIWDNAGKDHYNALRPICFANADVVVVTYAVDK